MRCISCETVGEKVKKESFAWRLKAEHFDWERGMWKKKAESDNHDQNILENLEEL